MKIKTFACRVAQKTNCPEMASYILNRLDAKELPTKCLIWTGNRMGKDRVARMTRRRHELVMRTDHPAAYIQFNGKRQPVNRVIQILRTKSEEEFRLKQICGTPFCVNPLHWEVRHSRKYTLDDTPPELDAEEPWTSQDVEELLEILLTEHNPTNWESVVNSELMYGAPAELMIAVLSRMNKRHLCPEPR